MTEDTATHDTDDTDIAALEREGDLAADYLERLLDIADLDGDLDLDVAQGRATVSVTGGGAELERLGTPSVVQALQDLTRLAVQTQSGQFSRLVLDIGGSREARSRELKRSVDHAITALIAGQTSVELEAMSSYERKIVHDYVAERGYHSESFGEGPNRRLVITRAAASGA